MTSGCREQPNGGKTMASDQFSRRNLDPDSSGVNPPLRNAEADSPALLAGYPGGKSWELHPHDETALIREGQPFLPLGVYARELLLRRDTDVGRLMLSLAAHRANCVSWDLLPATWAVPVGGISLLLPWSLDRQTGLPIFDRLHSAYFSRLDVLLHAITESNMAILVRLPGPADLGRLQIPAPAWEKFLAELVLRILPYQQVAFAVDPAVYNDLCRSLAPQLPEFRAVAYLAVESPAADARRLEALATLNPRPRLLWLHSESLLTPHFGVPTWTGPLMHSYTRPSVPKVVVPAVTPAAVAGQPVRPGADPAALAAAWCSVLQNAGVLWSYTDVAIFQSPLHDLAPMLGIAKVFEDLQVEWTGLSAARHLFDCDVVQQPQAVMSRRGAVLGFFPTLHDDGLRVWLPPVAHQVTWYRPLEGNSVYTASGIVGNSFGAVAVPTPTELVGHPALLALVPEN